jgi:ribosomal protein S14
LIDALIGANGPSQTRKTQPGGRCSACGSPRTLIVLKIARSWRVTAVPIFDGSILGFKKPEQAAV